MGIKKLRLSAQFDKLPDEFPKDGTFLLLDTGDIGIAATWINAMGNSGVIVVLTGSQALTLRESFTYFKGGARLLIKTDEIFVDAHGFNSKYLNEIKCGSIALTSKGLSIVTVSNGSTGSMLSLSDARMTYFGAATSSSLGEIPTTDKWTLIAKHNGEVVLEIDFGPDQV